MPDSSIYFKNISEEKGVNAHIQVNNIYKTELHTNNGETLFSYALDIHHKDADNKEVDIITKLRTAPKRTHIESSIAKINLLNNMYLQDTIGDDRIGIYAVSSSTIDSSLTETAKEALFSLAATILIPTSLALGIPFVMNILVSEKEHRIKSLLVTNGLVTWKYWAAIFIFNFAILEILTFVFFLFGRLFLFMEFFKLTSFVLLMWFGSLWNMIQISFSLAISKFFEISSTSLIFGLNFTFLSIFTLSMISNLVFPSPNMLPIYFYILP